MNLSTESYKGVRDFYPEDMFVQKYLFTTMRKVVESFGYLEYGASILEPTELYKAKTGEEIVNEQTYSFKDRGERDVTLRPEMTPTVARMVAARKRELSFPLRWYSIPNLFRYEKPQRGRLREHFQLNVDIFGATTLDAEKEIITIASDILRAHGAKNTDFVIRVSSRKLLDYVLQELFKLSEINAKAVTKLLDRKDKMSDHDFHKQAEALLADNTEAFIELFKLHDPQAFRAYAEKHFNADIDGMNDVEQLCAELKEAGIDNAIFDPTLARGFDYYTGIVFEVFDTDKANPRALFGGGRYDDLLSIFGTEKVPAVGFGMGDVTLYDFLETRKLLPKYLPSAKLFIARADGATQKDVDALAHRLRARGVRVAVNLGDKKLSDQLKKASKDKTPFVIVVGEKELASKKYTLKDMEMEETKEVTEEQITKELS